MRYVKLKTNEFIRLEELGELSVEQKKILDTNPDASIIYNINSTDYTFNYSYTNEDEAKIYTTDSLVEYTDEYDHSTTDRLVYLAIDNKFVDLSINEVRGDYESLQRKPKINNVVVDDNMSSSDLKLQDELVSGTNIKTINNESLLGSGNIDVSGGGSGILEVEGTVTVLDIGNVPDLTGKVVADFEGITQITTNGKYWTIIYKGDIAADYKIIISHNNYGSLIKCILNSEGEWIYSVADMIEVDNVYTIAGVGNVPDLTGYTATHLKYIKAIYCQGSIWYILNWRYTRENLQDIILGFGALAYKVRCRYSNDAWSYSVIKYEYPSLDNRPRINNQTIELTNTSSSLKLQDELISGTNIKTINNESILGEGNIDVGGGGNAVIEVSKVVSVGGVASVPDFTGKTPSDFDGITTVKHQNSYWTIVYQTLLDGGNYFLELNLNSIPMLVKYNYIADRNEWYVNIGSLDYKYISVRPKINGHTINVGDNTLEELGINTPRIATNITVDTSLWQTGSASAEFPYSAKVNVTGITTQTTPMVNFSISDADLGILASYCSSGDGYIEIYASELPTTTITIDNVVMM